MTTYVPTAAALVLWCTTCETDRAFGPVECGDGHDDECPERGCVECGLAAVVLVGERTAERTARAA